jgi:hypothetical protein
MTTIPDAQHIFSQDIACTLLQHVDGELKDVAKGSIVHPKNRMFHSKPMPDGMFRVSVAWVLPGCNGLDPPVQPDGAEEHTTLKGCHD